MFATAISVGTVEMVVPLFFNTPLVGNDVTRTAWSESPALGSANPGLKVAAEKVRVVSSFVLGETFETTGGCSTCVTVGSDVPPTVGSSVRTFEKLAVVLETVPWFEIDDALVGWIWTAKVTTTDFPFGSVPMVSAEPRKWLPVTLPGTAPSASPFAGKRRSPFVRNPYIKLSRSFSLYESGRPIACPISCRIVVRRSIRPAALLAGWV